jgi:hypothetical protein
MDPGETGLDLIGDVMAFTQAQLDALKSAIATGALEVRNANGEQVKYRSLDEMKRIVGLMETEIGATRAASFNPAFDKGM